MFLTIVPCAIQSCPFFRLNVTHSRNFSFEGLYNSTLGPYAFGCVLVCWGCLVANFPNLPLNLNILQFNVQRVRWATLLMNITDLQYSAMFINNVAQHYPGTPPLMLTNTECWSTLSAELALYSRVYIGVYKGICRSGFETYEVRVLGFS